MYRTTRLFRTACLCVVAFCCQQASGQDTISSSDVFLDPPSKGHTSAAACESTCESDRVFLISTRHLTNNICAADLEHPCYRIWQCGSSEAKEIDLEEYLSLRQPCRPTVIYLHGNRMDSKNLMNRFQVVRQSISACRRGGAIDWIVFSWPSQRVDLGLSDFRIKASRCDVQGLYLAWLMRDHALAGTPMNVIGYSFGARVATGALHALAGGKLGGRCLPGTTVRGADVRVGLIAPAVESNWLSSRGYHGFAAQNMERLTLLYNRRDAVLKRYWLLEKSRQQLALGFTGPKSFALRSDGSHLPVASKDFSSLVRICHSEAAYYEQRSGAGPLIARLIDGTSRALSK